MVKIRNFLSRIEEVAKLEKSNFLRSLCGSCNDAFALHGRALEYFNGYIVVKQLCNDTFAIHRSCNVAGQFNLNL